MDRMVKDGQDGERMDRMVEERIGWWRTVHDGRALQRRGYDGARMDRMAKDRQDGEGWTGWWRTGYDGGGEDCT